MLRRVIAPPSYVINQSGGRKMKKILSIALVLILAVGLLAGCGGGTTTSPSPSASKAPSAAPVRPPALPQAQPPVQPQAQHPAQPPRAEPSRLVSLALRPEPLRNTESPFITVHSSILTRSIRTAVSTARKLKSFPTTTKVTRRSPSTLSPVWLTRASPA